MIGGLIIIYLYVLIALWLIAMAYKHAVVIDEFSIKRWILGSSRSAMIAKFITAIVVFISAHMLLGYVEFMTL